MNNENPGPKAAVFVSLAPLPTPYQREVMVILIEECTEVQQRATKLLRFGAGEIQPGQLLDNIYRLSLEIGDLLEVIDLAIDARLVLSEAVVKGQTGKRKQLVHFMQTGGSP